MFLLAIDLGTTSLKVSLVDENARVVCSAHERVPTHSPFTGWSEQDPSDWLDRLLTNLRSVLSRHPEAPAAIAGIAVTGHMLGCLPVDCNGQPLGSHFLHSDARARAEVNDITRLISRDDFYNLTGNILAEASLLPKVLWLKKHQPDLYNRAACFLQAKDFITGWLTGSFRSTDLSDASHCGMIDIRSRAYPQDLYRDLGIDLDKMPEIHAGTDVIGGLCPAAADLLALPAGIPVVAGAGDGACSAAGAGAGSPGDCYCCLGTTAWIATLSARPVLDHQSRCYSIITGDGQAIGSYGTIQNCGRSTDFARQLFQIPDMQVFNEMAVTIDTGAGGLFFLPWLGGERAPLFDPDAQGAFIGLRLDHTAAHCLRAVLEGIAYALNSNAEVHRQNGLAINYLNLIGGGGQSDLWRQILASVLQASIGRVDVPSADATTLGAALLAGTGIGLFPSLRQGMALIKVSDVTVPDPVQADIYKQYFQTYQGFYPALRGSFVRMASL